LRFAALAAAALLAAACASTDDKPRGPELFAVIPHGGDGHVGAIVVHRGGKSQVVNTAYGAQRIDDQGIRSRPITPEQVRAALQSAHGGPVAEGSVGAGTGTVAFGWKGGIGTASRVLPAALGGYTLGVLVQTNFGGVLQVVGAPVGRELGKWAFQREVQGSASTPKEKGDGSVIIVVATDAPVSDRNLRRIAARAMMGLARTGSSASNGSGDYALAFSTSPSVRRRFDARRLSTEELSNDEMSGLFEAVVEATEEAIYDSLFMATRVSGSGHSVGAIPLDSVRAVLRKYRVDER